MKAKRRRDPFLLSIAVFKFVKGAALLAASFGALSLLHKNVAAHVGQWLSTWGIDPGNPVVTPAMEKLGQVHTRQLAELSVAGLCYAALFLTEGTGLMLRQHWAEWLTVIATASLLPVEIYHMFHALSVFTIAVFLLNIAIVLFLIYRIRSRRAA